MSASVTALDLSSQVHYKTSLNDSIGVYEKLMSPVNNSKTAALTDLELAKEHDQATSIALSYFRGQVKFQDKDSGAKYESEFIKELNKKFEDYKTLNQFKYRNKLEGEKIERLRKEQEAKERERVELEGRLRQLREENLELNSNRNERGNDERPDDKHWLVRIIEAVTPYYYPLVQTVVILSLLRYAFDYIKTLNSK